MELTQEKSMESVEQKPKKQHLCIESNFREAAFDEKGNKVRVVLITEGMGNQRDRNWYTKEAILKAPSIFEGVQSYLDHPSVSEERDRPERSVKELCGYFTDVEVGTFKYQETEVSALYANLNFDESDAGRNAKAKVKAALEYAKKYPDKNLVYAGLSINADGRTEPAEINNQQVNKVMEFTSAFSVDVVTKPARGGKFMNFTESIRGFIRDEIQKIFNKKNATEAETEIKSVKKLEEKAESESTTNTRKYKLRSGIEKFLSQKQEVKKNILKEVPPPGWEKAVLKMKDKAENPWALAWYLHGQGVKPSSFEGAKCAENLKKEAIPSSAFGINLLPRKKKESTNKKLKSAELSLHPPKAAEKKSKSVEGKKKEPMGYVIKNGDKREQNRRPGRFYSKTTKQKTATDKAYEQYYPMVTYPKAMDLTMPSQPMRPKIARHKIPSGMEKPKMARPANYPKPAFGGRPKLAVSKKKREAAASMEQKMPSIFEPTSNMPKALQNKIARRNELIQEARMIHRDIARIAAHTLDGDKIKLENKYRRLKKQAEDLSTEISLASRSLGKAFKEAKKTDMLKWRGKQKRGAIMKPSTFEDIAAKAKKAGADDPEAVAGAAYWQMAKTKYKKAKAKKAKK